MQDICQFRTNIYNILLELATEEGINASGKDEVFGCIFGRDSAITILKLLKVIERDGAKNIYNVSRLENIIKKSLLTLVTLQGKENNPESGEQPGKFIHEYRKDNYERLIKREKPWYIYPDGKLRNYDSLDSTPLGLIAIYKYWGQSGDGQFLKQVLPAVEKGLNWIINFADLDKDSLVEYELARERVHGGLPVQSWTDSAESLKTEDGFFPLYPIAPVEVQGYAWLALKLWADFYKGLQFETLLSQKAESLKKRFNKTFLFENEGYVFPVQALDGEKNQIRTITGNPLLLLWATYSNEKNKETILDKKYIDDLVKRAFKNDLFDSSAGIRTMSTTSHTYNNTETSYHNGSFWPKLNGMSHEGLMNWEYNEHAELLKAASLAPVFYFKTPIELYLKSDAGYLLYRSSRTGQTSCLKQAWSAASVLDLLT